MEEKPGWEKATEGVGAEGLLRAAGTVAMAVGAVLVGGVWLLVKAFGAALRAAFFCTRW